MSLSAEGLLSNGTPWSQQQREWLQALGHDVLMLAPTPVAAMGAPSVQAVGVAHVPENAGTPAQRPIVPVQTPVAGRTVADSPLLRALARAAGCQPQDAEFLRVLPELSTLRGNPVARRKLWPLLRALRKVGQR